MFFRFLALIGLSAFALYWFHLRTCPEDLISYETLALESAQLRTRRAFEETPAHQKRRGVQKDIWSQDRATHFQIRSDHSTLTLWQKKEKVEAVELLGKTHCSTNSGHILTADEGIYAFPSHQFILQKNCHLFQNGNEIAGSRIHFDLTHEVAIYEDPRGRLTPEDPLYFTSKQLIWHKKEGTLTLTRPVTLDRPDQFTLTANRGTLTLDKLEPNLLVLDGNVRLLSSRIQDKESHALADTLTYDPHEKTILLSSAKKVLFWHEGLSLSADEVLIRPDQTVEGRGDVHGSFDLEEQHSIDSFFDPYL